jgi:AraC family transcriptional regulator
LPRHAHAPATLNVVLDGHYGEAVERRALETHGPATLIAKPAGAVHENRVGPASVECLVIAIAPDALADEMIVHRSAGVAVHGGRLRAELVRGDDLSPLVIEGLVLDLLAEMERSPLRRSDPGKPWVLRARDLLHDERGPQSLSALAHLLELHPIYLARAFRARFGCSVGEYARGLRVERARRLLHHTRLDLCEIAGQVGYSDQSHMTREFRHVFRQSPAAYRRLVRRVP